MFFSSHVLAEVEELCDRVAMVRDGRLLVAGPARRPGGLAHAARGGALRAGRWTRPATPWRAWARREVEGRRHRFSLSGDPAPLLAALAALPVEEVTIERASLEDAFRELYSDGPAA